MTAREGEQRGAERPRSKVWEAAIPRDLLLARVTRTMIDAVKLKRAEKVQKSSVDRNLQVLRRLLGLIRSGGQLTDVRSGVQFLS